MEWVASTLHTTSEHVVSSITTADAHKSAATSRLNWRPRRFKWTRPFRRKTKSGFCVCAITFQTQSNNKTWLTNFHKGLEDLWSNSLSRSNAVTFDNVWSGTVCELWRGTWIKVRLLMDFQIYHYGLLYKNRNSKKRTNQQNAQINFGLINLLLFSHSNMFRPLNRSHHQGIQNLWELQAIVVIC